MVRKDLCPLETDSRNGFILKEFWIIIKAEVAHLVERQPSKLRVAGSSPVFRSF